ncbi:hypothetical protein M4914_09695 [Streptomyces somaliensis DSM 40738]|uniref:Uncharacterized protein n=1 Tax=Streptomyces somaliensis (strain ATCC 33201 / DSM 40738 / JCM 12659 / KCTC 9044 / NCTC 11332 / NRRL B-12077 / IP 733) TaxID=1134445 RepID=A0AA44DDF1_STRE0|nr:hypothetical protein [Streptomyces somaliensis]MCQ0023191.1 hypothetical protein [Streptomyces somaliensis DSM 40738]NKY14355.1 hypothetical protein [Streptomyces somaliensis DSM 40738]
MRMRHIRAVAVFGVVLIALTGARGSGGGSCGGSSSGSGAGSGGGSGSGGYSGTSGSGDYSSGGSGSGGGYSSGGSDYSSGGSGSGSSSGSGSGGGYGSGGSVPSGSGSNSSAMRDIRIDECKLDASGRNLVARLTVTNRGSLDYEYEATIQFKGATGASAPYAAARVDDLLVPANGSRTTEATTAYTGTQNGSEYTQCVVTRAHRTMS